LQELPSLQHITEAHLKQTLHKDRQNYNAQRSYSDRTARHYQDLAQKVDLSSCRQLEKIEVM
jgi:hypothetical protein